MFRRIPVDSGGRRIAKMRAEKVNFWLRLRLAINFVLSRKQIPTRTTTCGRCGSQAIMEIREPIQGALPEYPQYNLIWTDTCKCLKCGAEVIEVQYWSWENSYRRNG